MDNQWLYLLAFGVYLLLMIGISWFVSRGQQSSSDYLLAGRQVPLYLTLGTTVATMVGTGSSMGAVGFAYQHAWAGALYGVGGALGILLLAWWFAPVRRQGFATMSEELASYVGDHGWVKKILALLIYAASLGWLGAHLIGGGMYLSWLTGMTQTEAKLLIGIGLAVYVTLGGYSAVIWTDSLQAIVLFVGFILMAYFAVDLIGGWSQLQTHPVAAQGGLFSYSHLGVVPAISMALVVLVGVLATPSFRQRIYAAEDVKSIRTSFVLSGLLYLAFSLIPAVIGISAYLLHSGLDNPAYAFPYLALNSLPAILGGVILLAGISATLSSASSDAIAGVSVLVNDLYQQSGNKTLSATQSLWLSRLAMVVTVAIALMLAMLSSDIITYITHMISVVLAGLCVFGLLGRFWSGYTWQGSLATLLGGAGAALWVGSQPTWLAWFGNPILLSLTSAATCGVVVSLVTQTTGSKAKEVINKESLSS